MSARQITADSAYPRLKARILASTGLAYYEDRDEDIGERVGRRLAALNIRDCDSYLALLDDAAAGPAEMDALVAELTIGETYFYRHREQFDALRSTVLPAIFERKRAQRTLRIWSAGCATGAEPYSVALLLLNDMPEEVAGWDVSILGTDINRGFLARARAARFDDWAFRDGAANLKRAWFDRDGRHWVLRPKFREWVSFQYHNLVTDTPPAAGFDLILCRNVLIYFNRQTAHHVAATLYEALAPNGWLMVGHAEPSAEVFRAFRTVIANGLTFYRKPDPAGEPQTAGASVHPSPSVPVAPPAQGAVGISADWAASLSLPYLAPWPVVPPSPPTAEPELPLVPADSAAALAEARQLADRGEWDRAAARCHDVLAADSLNAVAHFTLAQVLEHTGDIAEAERSLRAAIYLDRGFALAHVHLGLVLQQRNARQPARRAFENALKFLDALPGAEVVEYGDGITAAELRETTRLHLELLGDE